MPEPTLPTSATPRFALPHLFAAQAQKEFIVNEANARLDVVLHCAVAGVSATPPEDPADGETWLVAANPEGAWAGREGMLAGRQAGTWVFVAPRQGLRVYDDATRQFIHFDQDWVRVQSPAEPIGGTAPDAEARAAIGNLIERLQAAGIFPAQQ